MAKTPRTPQLPVVAEAAPLGGPGPQPSPDAGFSAQALGQPGQKRGLRGGAPVLNAARQSYLQTQWAGPGDRRTPAGVIRRDKV